MDVAVGEGGQDAAAAEVHDFGRRERRLVRADPAGDQLPGDGKRPCAGQRGVHRADDAVLQDHAASLTPLVPEPVDVACWLDGRRGTRPTARGHAPRQSALGGPCHGSRPPDDPLRVRRQLRPLGLGPVGGLRERQEPTAVRHGTGARHCGGRPRRRAAARVRGRRGAGALAPIVEDGLDVVPVGVEQVAADVALVVLGPLARLTIAIGNRPGCPPGGTPRRSRGRLRRTRDARPRSARPRAARTRRPSRTAPGRAAGAPRSRRTVRPPRRTPGAASERTRSQRWSITTPSGGRRGSCTASTLLPSGSSTNAP